MLTSKITIITQEKVKNFKIMIRKPLRCFIYKHIDIQTLHFTTT